MDGYFFLYLRIYALRIRIPFTYLTNDLIIANNHHFTWVKQLTKDLQ